jgi:hypothetical protein
MKALKTFLIAYGYIWAVMLFIEFVVLRLPE